jgi:hypothetical protein
MDETREMAVVNQQNLRKVTALGCEVCGGIYNA